MSHDTPYPLDYQQEDGSTTMDGHANFNVNVTQDGDRVVLFAFNQGGHLVNFLSADGALALGRALVAAAHDVQRLQVEGAA